MQIAGSGTRQYDLRVCWTRFLAASILMLAACSDQSPSASAAFVGVDYETVDCEPGGEAVCVRVFSGVDRTGVGRGSCLLYASTAGGQVAVAASGELGLTAGIVLEWIVRASAHLGSLGWNPVCAPTAEG